MLLSQMNLHIPVAPFLVFVLLTLLLLTWVIFTLVVRYHWKNYGTSQLEVMSMSFIYFVGSLILLAATAIFAFLYYVSAQ